MAPDPAGEVDTVATELAAIAEHARSAGEWDVCAGALRQILARGFEDDAEVQRAYGVALTELGQLDEAVAAFRRALPLEVDDVRAHTNLITLLDIQPASTAEERRQAREAFWKRYGAPLSGGRVYANDPNPDRPLRIGYLSGDFRWHAVAVSVTTLITNPSAGFVPYYYSNLPSTKWDGLTAKYYREPHFRDVSYLTDAQIAAQIRKDQIDILVDLSGYTPYHRLLVCCRKPAPVQISAWGYGPGTGLPVFDAHFSDAFCIPAADRAAYGERAIIDLPSFLTYDGFESLPPANALPCLSDPPTFGVVQRPAKITDAAVRSWAAILRAVPGSRLIIKNDAAPSTRRRWQELFADVATRVEYRTAMPPAWYMRDFQGIDLLLDTFVHSGGVTTLDGLWMGVPCVTLCGDRMWSRVSSSFLTTLGLTEFIAHSEQEYLEKAVSWTTTRRQELAAIRLALRDHLRSSPICQGYRDAVEAQYRALWRTWCAGQGCEVDKAAAAAAQ